MYLEHFEWCKPPFAITPDLHFFMGLPTHQEALNVLLLGLKNGEGFIKLVGEVGTGKTLLCRKLLHTLRDDNAFQTVYIINPALSRVGVYHALASALSLRVSVKQAPHLILSKLHRHLLSLHQQNRRVVLLVDEAQAMSYEALEGIRLLTNLETDDAKLLQVVLVGQPELDHLLAQDRLRQLRQRITFGYCLKSLSRSDVASYVQHRIQLARADATDQRAVFSQSALSSVHKASRGIPRVVNLLCHKALLIAYGRGAHQATLQDVHVAVMDTEYTASWAQAWWRRCVRRVRAWWAQSYV